MSKFNYKDIPKFPHSNYSVNMPMGTLVEVLEDFKDKHRLNLEPEFQRGYVWTREQKIAFVEYRLKGGLSGADIYFNYPGWLISTHDENGSMVIVDGKQRLSAAIEFWNNELPVFGGHLRKDIEGFPRFMTPLDFRFHINNLHSDLEVVEWYIGFNTGGSIHTEADLKPAIDLLEKLKTIK